MTVEGVGELAQVVVIAELQWAASMVRDTVYVWPLNVIIPGVVLVIKVDILFFQVVETLLPPSVFFAVVIARFLSNMGKEGG